MTRRIRRVERREAGETRGWLAPTASDTPPSSRCPGSAALLVLATGVTALAFLARMVGSAPLVAGVGRVVSPTFERLGRTDVGAVSRR